MDKWIIRITCLLLCLILLLGLVAPVFADETEETTAEETVPEETVPEETVPWEELTIRTAEDFLEFAENCRLDSYSRELYVSLEADIDLTGAEFQGIPSFSGTFAGNGHTISGLDITGHGSNLGLFRYLTESALVCDLTVEGNVTPEGSREAVGAIAGSNEGRIENCHFSGTVTGIGDVGGLVGINAAGGIIDGCSVMGSVSGNHFAGGVAGENRGTILNCVNRAQVNTTAKQNSVELSDITVDTLMGTESAATVTDIGGIAGSSSGVILSCENRGDVGYRHMGYNIGGIVGSQTGFVSGCVNYGQVYGRKEVGGIAGQLEPYTVLRYETDTIQILQTQAEILGNLVDKAAGNAGSNVASIQNLLFSLQSYVYRAESALKSLTDLENLSLDTIASTAQELRTCISGIEGTMRSLSSAISGTTGTLMKDLEAVGSQVDVITGILEGAEEDLGGTMADISDRDTEEDMTAKIRDCENFGSVLADMNAGGIVGSMALENDLDPEEDVEISGNTSLNMATEMRAVVRDCRNSGSVTGGKRNVGGIVGWMSLGLVRDCVSTGTIDGSGASYVGGIAGRSDGYIRDCSAKTAISGGTAVGGIAGTGTIVTGCRSMVTITGASEKFGAVLGQTAENHTDEEMPIRGNLYLCVGTDVGAIDGISYDGMAQPMEQDSFLALEGIPEIFSTVTVTFVFEDGSVETVALTPGTVLTEENIPALPAKDGCEGVWEGLPEVGAEEILFDTTVSAKYTGYVTVIQSQLLRDGLPVVLVEGAFETGAAVELARSDEWPTLEQGQSLTEAWSMTVVGGTVEKVRYLLPGEADPDHIRLMVRAAWGIWKEAEFTVDGSYLVFAVNDGDQAFALVSERDMMPVILAFAAGVCGCGLIVGIALLMRGRKKKAK